MVDHDDTCSEEHDELKKTLTDIKRALEFHIGETHTQAGAVIEGDRRRLDEIGEVVLGVKHVNFDGEITRTGGMKALVSANENGGLRFKYTNLIVSTLAVVLVALIGLGGAILNHQTQNRELNNTIVEQVQSNTDQLERILTEMTVPSP